MVQYSKWSLKYKEKHSLGWIYWTWCILWDISQNLRETSGTPCRSVSEIHSTIGQGQSLKILSFIRVEVYSIFWFASFLHSFYAFLSDFCLIACLIPFFVTSFATRLGRPKDEQSVLHSVARPLMLLIDFR